MSVARITVMAFCIIASAEDRELYVGTVLLASPRLRSDSHRQRSAADRGASEPDRSTPLRYPAWVGLFACYFGLGVVVAVFPVASRDVLGLSASVIGGLFLVRGLANTAAFLGLGRTGFWHHRTWPMFASQAVGAITYVGLAWAHSAAVLAALLAILGLHVAASYSASIFHGAAGSRDRIKRMAIHESVLALGLVAGSVIGGTVYQARGMAAVYCTCAAVLLAGALAQCVLCRSAACLRSGPGPGIEDAAVKR
jgi:predicted MFS family arabinose efflux permease